MFILKVISSVLMLTAGVGAMASEPPEFRTQDNIDYIFTVRDNLSKAQLRACLKTIRALAVQTGTGYFEYFTAVGSGAANLSTAAADSVGQMSCILAIEPSGEVHAQPRVGRQNSVALDCEGSVLGTDDKE